MKRALVAAVLSAAFLHDVGFAGAQPLPPGPPVPPPATTQDLYTSERCSERLTLCLGTDGRPLLELDSVPKLGVDEVLSILVIGVLKNAGEAYEVTSTEDINRDTLMPGAVAPAAAGAGALVLARHEVKASSKTRSFTIRLQYRAPAATTFKPVGRGHTIPVSRGEYAFDVGLLVPLTIVGYEVHATRLPGSDDRYVSTVERVDVRSAIAVNVFPGGHPNDVIFPARDGNCGDWIGFQLGVDLDLSDPEAIYGGAIFEPVSGIGVGFGLSLLRADVLDDGWESGMLLRPGESAPTHKEVLPRGYIGITVSTEVVDAIRTAASELRGTE